MFVTKKEYNEGLNKINETNNKLRRKISYLEESIKYLENLPRAEYISLYSTGEILSTLIEEKIDFSTFAKQLLEILKLEVKYTPSKSSSITIKKRKSK